MQNNPDRWWDGFILIPKRITAALLLWALLTLALSPSLATAGTVSVPEGMVYCPLSRQFQPVHPPEEKKELEPFDNICASPETKEFLYREIFVKNLFRKIPLETTALDKLTFDFLARGAAAFKELPNFPNFPPENLLQQINPSAATAGHNYEHKFTTAQALKPAYLPLLARPPTLALTALDPEKPIHQSDEVSRRLAPRAPPIFS